MNVYSIRNEFDFVIDRIVECHETIAIAPLQCKLEAKHNPDFDRLRDNPEFKALIDN